MDLSSPKWTCASLLPAESRAGMDRRHRSHVDSEQGQLPRGPSSANPARKRVWSFNTKISDWLRGVGQNLEQACEISLTFARLDRSLHEVNVRIRNSVVRTSILAPAYKLLGDHRIRFERSLIAAVIFGRNSPRHVGED